jgi:hypothetical protein
MEGITDSTKRRIIEAFNNKPKNGINILKEVCELNKQLIFEKELAKLFLEKKRDLNLDYVGDYLGSQGEENKKTLDYFAEKIDFQDKDFVPALREYLQAFKLPGEAQKIDRLVEKFGKQYCEQNPGKEGIKSKDAAYVLAFQAIMLNSDLHKEGVKQKMTLGELKKNLKGCNDGKNFSDELLEGMYNNIQHKPFEFNFVKAPVGYTIHESKLLDDVVYQGAINLLDGKYDDKNLSNDLKTLFPSLKKEGDFAVKTEQPKTSWLKKFTGYEGDITITDKKTNESVRVQIYKPGLVAKWFLGDVPKIIVHPVSAEGKEPTDKAIEMAANITAGFKLPVTIGATYDYQKEDLLHKYTTVVVGAISTAHSDPKTTSKTTFSNMVNKQSLVKSAKPIPARGSVASIGKQIKR